MQTHVAYAKDKEIVVKYSGHVVDLHHDYPPLLREIEAQVEAVIGEPFNHVMLNRYESGKEYIGKHRDTKENKVRYWAPSLISKSAADRVESDHSLTESRRRADVHYASKQT